MLASLGKRSWQHQPGGGCAMSYTSFANTLQGKELVGMEAQPAGLRHLFLYCLYVSSPAACQVWCSTTRSCILQTDLDLTYNKGYILSGVSMQTHSCVCMKECYIKQCILEMHSIVFNLF